MSKRQKEDLPRIQRITISVKKVDLLVTRVFVYTDKDIGVNIVSTSSILIISEVRKLRFVHTGSTSMVPSSA